MSLDFDILRGHVIVRLGAHLLLVLILGKDDSGEDDFVDSSDDERPNGGDVDVFKQETTERASFLTQPLILAGLFCPGWKGEEELELERRMSAFVTNIYKLSRRYALLQHYDYMY